MKQATFPRSALRDNLPLIILSAAFIAVRLLLLLSNPHAIYDDEEMFNGTAARELLRGLHLPLGEYMYWPHEGGALVMTLIATIFFRLFGDGYVVMKLPALAFSFGAFLLWYMIAKRFAGSKTAIRLALLYIFAPPLLLKSDLMLWGHQNNVNLLVAAAVYLLMRQVSERFSSGSRWLLIALGGVCGFGIFFNYIFFVVLIAVSVILLLEWMYTKRMNLFLFFPAALLGFLPWILIRLSGAVPAVSLFEARGAAGTLGILGFLRKGVTLLFRDLPLSPCFPENLGITSYFFSRVFFALLVLLALGAVVSLARAWLGKSPSLRNAGKTLLGDPALCVQFVAFLFCIIYVVAYCVSPFLIWRESGELRDYFVIYRYVLPLYPFLLFLAAQSVHKIILSQVRIRRLRFAGFALLLLLGVVSVFTAIPVRDVGKSLSLRGFSYERFGWAIFVRHVIFRPEDPGYVVRVAKTVDPSYTEGFYRGVGWGVAQFGYEEGQVFTGGLVRLAKFTALWPADLRHYAYQGLGWKAISVLRGNVQEGVRLGYAIPSEFRDAYFLGMGWAIASRFYRDMSSALSLIQQIPEEYRYWAYYGFGWRQGENKAAGVAFESAGGKIDTKWRVAVSAGEEETLRWYGEGQFLEGPVWMSWGGISFRKYGQ